MTSSAPSQSEVDMDWGDDQDEPIVATCNLENPEACEACD